MGRAFIFTLLSSKAITSARAVTVLRPSLAPPSTSTCGGSTSRAGSRPTAG